MAVFIPRIPQQESFLLGLCVLYAMVTYWYVYLAGDTRR